MRLIERKSIRILLLVVAAAIVSSLLAFLANFLSGASIGPVLLSGFAVVCSATIVVLARHCNIEGGSNLFADRAGQEIDHIVTGAAETSYFVDLVKKKSEKDVQTINEILSNSEQDASTTEQIAVNAERVSKVATDVRRESVSGHLEANQGLHRIHNARQDVQSASAMMSALQEKSRRIHVITETLNEIAAHTDEHGIAASKIESLHDPSRLAVQAAAKEVDRIFTGAIAGGQISREALFDCHCKPIPNTNSQKYSTRFNVFTDRVLPEMRRAFGYSSSVSVENAAAAATRKFSARRLGHKKCRERSHRRTPSAASRVNEDLLVPLAGLIETSIPNEACATE